MNLSARNAIWAAQDRSNPAATVRTFNSATVEPTLLGVLVAAVVITAADLVRPTAVPWNFALNAARLPAAAANSHRPAGVTTVVIPRRSTADHVAGSAVVAALLAAPLIRAALLVLWAGHAVAQFDTWLRVALLGLLDALLALLLVPNLLALLQRIFRFGVDGSRTPREEANRAARHQPERATT